MNGWGLTWSQRASLLGAKSISGPRGTVLLSTSPPLAVHRAALTIKRAFPGVRWIADFRDPILSSFGSKTLWGPRFSQFLERKIFATADLVIANTEPAAARWRERFPEYQSKIYALWNGFDPEDPIAAFPLPDRPYRVLAHFGSMYAGRQPGRLAASVERLIESKRLDNSTIRIRLVGSPRSEAGESLAGLDKVGCVDFLNRVPRPEAQKLMATSDYLLLLDLEGHTGGLHIPAKIFEYLRIGRPILAYTCRDSAVERVLDRSGVPHVCVHQTDSDSEADRKLVVFLGLPTEPVKMAPAFEEDFSAPAQVARLASWLCPNFTMPREAQDATLSDPFRNSR